jgi:hypothetical protein
VQRILERQRGAVKPVRQNRFASSQTELSFLEGRWTFDERRRSAFHAFVFVSISASAEVKRTDASLSCLWKVRKSREIGVSLAFDVDAHWAILEGDMNQ